MGADHHGCVIDYFEAFTLIRDKAITQSPILRGVRMAIALRNWSNSWRALNRGEGNSIGFVDYRFGDFITIFFAMPFFVIY